MKAEAHLCFASQTATAVHNRVRGFAGWPGTFSDFEMGVLGGEVGEWEGNPTRIKLLTTRVASADEPVGPSAGPYSALRVPGLRTVSRIAAAICEPSRLASSTAAEDVLLRRSARPHAKNM